jgi:GntR family phosphonate transport system transcriptional regulator
MTETGSAEPLARGGGVALWRQIFGEIEREIASGRHRPGARLPTEQVLTARFAVNRHTIRRAMEELEAAGLVRVEQGRGSFVAEDVLDYRLGARTRFTEVIRRQNREPAAHPSYRGSAGRSRRGRGARPSRGRPVVKASGWGLVDGRPVVLGTHFFSAARFPRIAAELAADPSVTRALAAGGVPDYRRRTTRVTARMPTPEEADCSSSRARARCWRPRR